jgi:hypothetical protein
MLLLARDLLDESPPDSNSAMALVQAVHASGSPLLLEWAELLRVLDERLAAANAEIEVNNI